MAGSGTAQLRDASEAIVRVENLVVEFPAPGGKKVHAVSDVSFDVYPGETLGIVGESGCGKSTTGRAILALPKPTSGKVFFEGTDLTTISGEELRAVRTKLQVIFQDPISSLYPRRTITDLVTEPLAIWGVGSEADRVERARLMLGEVNMDYDTVSWRRPYEFSIGQCQRISIARALMLNPKVIVCDEPVSALDVSVQAQILNLLEDMKRRYGLTLLFISHDLAVVKNVSDRVVVMFLGKLCEVADSETLYAQPAHPYTRALLMASVISSRAMSRAAGTGSDVRTARRSAAPRCRRRSARRAAAATAPAAHAPRQSVPCRSPSCARSSRTTTWPATSPSGAEATVPASAVSD